MPTQKYTLNNVSLKSTWRCYQLANGNYVSSAPTTATNSDLVVNVTGLPSGAVINSAILSYTVPDNPLNSAAVCTLNGANIGWRKGNHTANLGITGNGQFRLNFAFADTGSQHQHVYSHSSVLNLNNLVVTIDYVVPYVPSDWSVGASSVEAGNPIPVTVSPAGNGYNHKITAAFGTYNTSINLAAGVNVGSVPTALEWLKAIPNAASGTATLTLTTYHSGNVIGTSSKNVTITAPSGVIPSLNATVERLLTVGGVTFPDVTGGYVQQKSAAKCRITSASGAYGSTITSYSINVDGRTDAAFNSSGTELSTAALPMAGDVTITFRVTDSRGRTAQVVKTITVEPYSEPKANNLTVMRVDDSGNEDANGTKGRYSFTRIFASLSGKNSCTAAITAAGTTVENVGDNGWIVPGAIKTLDVLSSYRVEIKLTDAYGSTTTVATIPSINFALHFSADGTSVWVGEACQQSNAFGVSPNRNVYFYGLELRELIRATPPPALLYYPVGSIYMSADPTSPASLFGGTWELVENRFLLGASEENPLGSTGGNHVATLKAENLPQHTHSMATGEELPAGTGAEFDIYTAFADKYTNAAGKWYYTVRSGINENGNADPFAIMPPYEAVNIWKRVA